MSARCIALCVQRPSFSTRLRVAHLPWSSHVASFSSVPRMEAVLFDQTKKGNDPNAEKRDKHLDATKSDEQADSANQDSSQQGDLAKQPTSSTGIKSEGAGSSPGHDGNEADIPKGKFPEQ